MTDEITVHILTLDDYERWMSVWRRAGLRSIRPSGRDSHDAFSRQFATGTHTMLGLECGAELIGAVLATHDGRKGWINRLAVLPEYRRRGYAKNLVAEAERVLRGRGITVFAVLLEDGNDTSLALFRELGYADPPGGVHYLSKHDTGES